MRCHTLMVLAFGVLGAQAQTGTVSGHVSCADTLRPARFARVALVRNLSSREEPGDEQKPARPPGPKLIYASSVTDLEGSYRIADVPPGDYWVVATLAGYLLPVTQNRKLGDDANLEYELEAILNAPVVHVAADGSARTDVVLQKGGTLAGQVRYDDGSPVPNVMVKVELAEGNDVLSSIPKQLETMVVDGHYHTSHTDDQGRYRIAALAPGSYRVYASLTFSGGTQLLENSTNYYEQKNQGNPWGDSLQVYQPGKFLSSQATAWQIKGSEGLSGADIEVPLHGLHTLQGRIFSKADGHVPTHATIGLKLGTSFQRLTDAEPDGSYRLENIPEGTYQLSTRVVDSVAWPDEEAAQHHGRKRTQEYFPLHETVVVGPADQTVPDLLVVPRTP